VRNSSFCSNGIGLICAVGLASSAQAQIDPSGEWGTWHTEHFRVHAPSSYASAAVVAAREAERAYALLATELRPPRGAVDLVIADNVDFSNGYATVLPSNRVVVYLTPPSTAISSGNYDSWLRLVVTHELAHIFHLDRADGFWNVVQRVFGRAPGLFPNTYQPAWVTEGIATYYESRFSTAGRVRGSFHDQLLTGSARDDRWPAPGEATFANRVWPAGTRPYAWGSRFFEASSREFGDSTVARFVDKTSRQIIVFNVSSPMRSAGADGVDPGWERLRVQANRGGRSGEIVERGLRSEPRPRLSQDGGQLAYRRDDGRNVQQVVVLDAGSGGELAARRVNAVEGISWVGDAVFLTQLEFESPVEIRSSLYRWNPEGPLQRLTHDARSTDVFSVPGRGIGVVQLDSAVRTVRLLRRPGSDDEAIPLPVADDWGRIAVSPSGDWVGAARHSDGRWDIVIWPWGRPGDYEMVTDDAAMDADPVWTADGSELLFASERGGLPQIYAFSPESKNARRITSEVTGAREPAVAPDGTLYYSTTLGDGFALLVQRGRPAGGSESEDRAVPDAFVEAAAVPVRQSGYAPWASLRPHFWIPFFHDEKAAGLFVGALTWGTDALERTRYTALATAAPSTGRWEGLLSLLHSRWRSWSVDLAAAQTWDYGGLVLTESGNAVPVSFREHSAEIGLTNRWRRWRSGASWRIGAFVERDQLVNDGSEPLPFTPSNPTFTGGVLSAALNYSDQPALAISPENGGSIAGLYMRRWEIAGSDWSYELRGGVNGYLALPLPGFSHWVLAARATAGISGGTVPTRYAIGGVSGDAVPFAAGSTIGSGRRTFAMRGYQSGGRFTRAFVGITELRVPILLAGKAVGKLPLLVDKLATYLFWEFGGGWSEGEESAPTDLMDAGAEVVTDLGIGAGLLLRARLGAAVVLRDGLDSSQGDVRIYLALGQSF